MASVSDDHTRFQVCRVSMPILDATRPFFLCVCDHTSQTFRETLCLKKGPLALFSLTLVQYRTGNACTSAANGLAEMVIFASVNDDGRTVLIHEFSARCERGESLIAG